MTRRALVLSGGGARGAYQVGMLGVLVGDRELDFQILRGISVGALNAAFLAQARTGEQSLANLQAAVVGLTRLWTNEVTGNRSIYKERALKFVGLAAGSDSLFDNEPLAALLKKHVDPLKPQQSGRDFSVGTVSLVSGAYAEHVPTRPKYLDLILGSTAIPVVFPPVWRKVDGEVPDVLVDGGVREITPLSSAFRAKPAPDEIYVLLASRAERGPDGSLPDNTTMPSEFKDWDDNWLGTAVSGMDILKRAVDILTDEIYLDDIRGALEWNKVLRDVSRLLQAARAVGGQQALTDAAAAVEASLGASGKRHVKMNVLAPQQWFGGENSSTSFAPELISEAIQHGRDIAADKARWLLASD